MGNQAPQEIVPEKLMLDFLWVPRPIGEILLNGLPNHFTRIPYDPIFTELLIKMHPIMQFVRNATVRIDWVPSVTDITDR